MLTKTIHVYKNVTKRHIHEHYHWFIFLLLTIGNAIFKTISKKMNQSTPVGLPNFTSK